jgi:transposase
MQYKAFIGIDVSKRTIDAFIYGHNLYQQFSNDREGHRTLINWALKNLNIVIHTKLLICFEHTGLYSLSLAAYFDEIKVPFSMVSALQIKRSSGITRGKTDRIDSKRIAEYAYLYRESLAVTKLPSKAILQLQPLLTLRDRLVRDRSGYEATQKEQLRFLKDQYLSALYDSYSQVIEVLKNEIKKVEKAIKEILDSNEELKQVFELITGIKGVGFIIGAYMIVYTHNFTRFGTWRKFACYAGIAPFEYQSGTTVRGKTKVSPLANKQIKRMLHMAALKAAHSDKELSTYYHKRIENGKSKLETLNIIRNKVVSRMFAVVKRKTAYVDLMKFAA